jgi:hypothetical protein
MPTETKKRPGTETVPLTRTELRYIANYVAEIERSISREIDGFPLKKIGAIRRQLAQLHELARVVRDVAEKGPSHGG